MEDRTQPRSVARIVYDGSCAMCAAAARLSADSRALCASPSQEISDRELRELGLERGEIERALFLVDGSGALYSGHAAILAAMSLKGGIWRRLSSALSAPRLDPVLGFLYAAVARHRHQISRVLAPFARRAATTDSRQ
jgi:predicted DCC family thiol-disulfide oxidoreductase YuxK